MISSAKLWVFHILAKTFFPCVRSQCNFLDICQLLNVKICTSVTVMCKIVLFYSVKVSFLLELSAKTWFTIWVIWSFNS